MGGRRIVYTAPIKALSNQKFRDFREEHGEEVGIMTGDVTINPEAPLLIMTTEVFRNTIFESPERLEAVDFVVFDEVHYLDDEERGTVWEESILYAPTHIRIVALSATIPNIEQLARWMRKTRKAEVDVVVEEQRPVPLHHWFYIPDAGPRELRQLKGVLTKAARRKRFRNDNFPRHPLAYVVRENWLPALYFCFSRRDCEILCERQARTDHLDARERREILELFDDLARRYEVAGQPGTDRLRNLASKGTLYHHAGILPIHKEIVERLFTTGHVKILFATETFALGVNMPAKCVIFDTLRKFDGVDVRYMKTRDYMQMAGRAGRQGMDEEGLVLSRVDLEDASFAALQRVTEGASEPVLSRFNLSYSTLLNLYLRLGEGVYSAYDRSFAHFQETKAQRKSAAPRNRIIARRMKILRERGYASAEGITPRGELARKVNGYEIQVTEFYFAGLFERASLLELAALFVATVYEARKMDDTDPARIPVMEREAIALVADWTRDERRAELAELLKRPDFGLNSVVFAGRRGPPSRICAASRASPRAISSGRCAWRSSSCASSGASSTGRIPSATSSRRRRGGWTGTWSTRGANSNWDDANLRPTGYTRSMARRKRTGKGKGDRLSLDTGGSASPARTGPTPPPTRTSSMPSSPTPASSRTRSSAPPSASARSASCSGRGRRPSSIAPSMSR
ncbi:MAG: DEAD/DEAH box helicase [Planctomycetes bacterium]|nr:DEAD/DEAH box helicase [Planctomycetota bacterium]